MKNMQTQLDKLRSDAAECHVLSNIATDPAKRELFARLAEHMAGLVSEVEKAIATEPANVALAADHQQPAAIDQQKPSVADHEQQVGQLITYNHVPQLTNSWPRDHEPAAQSRMLPWLSVIAVVAIAGALVWANNRPENPSPLTTVVQASPEQSPAPQDDTKIAISSLHQALKDVQSGEQEGRKLLSEQVRALAARMDNLERARGEVLAPTRPPEQKEQSRSGSARARPHPRERDRRYDSFSAWVFPGFR
jgi:hypothetical protein